MSDDPKPSESTTPPPPPPPEDRDPAGVIKIYEAEEKPSPPTEKSIGGGHNPDKK